MICQEMALPSRLSVFRSCALWCLSFVVIASGARAVLLWLDPPHPIVLHVRWSPDVDALRRGELEWQLKLALGEQTEGTTWKYLLASPSMEDIRAIVQHPSVEDTAHLDRAAFRPELSQDRELRARHYALIIGGVWSLATFGLVWVWRRIGARRRLDPVYRRYLARLRRHALANPMS